MPADGPALDPIWEAHRQWTAHGWEASADGMAMVTSLVRVQQLLLDRIDGVLRPLGLTFARYEVLQLLAFTRRGALPMTRLGSLLQVHPTSVTSAVDRLQKQGFVTRVRDDGDRRVVRASLTDAGREVVDQATAGLNARVFERVGVDKPTVHALIADLARLRGALGDPVAPFDVDPSAAVHSD